MLILTIIVCVIVYLIIGITLSVIMMRFDLKTIGNSKREDLHAVVLIWPVAVPAILCFNFIPPVINRILDFFERKFK